MSKKYLSVEEAAQLLGVNTSEVLRAREADKIRGFADRGTWKFKAEDVEAYRRTQSSDSSLDVPLGDLDDSGSSDSSESHSVLSDDDVLSEQPTVIRKGEQSSDSDVRLIYSGSPATDAPLADSDSDVRLSGAGKSILDDSDSDVKLVRGDKSTSDVRLPKPDSNVTVAGVRKKGDSDSDVKLVGRHTTSEMAAKKPATADETVDLSPSDEGSVLDHDSGISLVGDSGISLENAADSGISLEQTDSGISLSSDSGLNLASDSGISLDITSDSGISLSDSEAKPKAKKGGKKGAKSDDEFGATMPELDAPLEDLDESDTNMEVPLLGEDSSDSSDSSYDLADSAETTSVITLDEDADEDSATVLARQRSSDEVDALEEAVFDESASEDVEVADEAGEDDELEEMDVFGAADEDFDDDFQAGQSQGDLEMPTRAAPVAVEHEWGGGVFATLCITAVVMILCGTVTYDLVQSIWHADVENRNPLAGMVLSALGSLFGG